MKAYLKSLDDTNKEVELTVGKTTLGRGVLLNCSDKKVSRNHAFIEVTNDGEIHLTSQHVNPCFYYSMDSNSTPKIIKKDVSQKLSDGDVFSLLANAYKYQIVIDSDNKVNNESNSSEDKREEKSINGENEKNETQKNESNDNKSESKKVEEFGDEDTKDNDSVASDVKKNDKKVSEEKNKKKVKDIE